MANKLFEKNPFVVVPGEFWADREFLWQRLIDYIEIARMTRSNEIIVLVGDYGCGTTHALKYIEKFLKQKGAFVSYFASPVSGDLSSFYRGFLEDIPDDKKRKIVEQLVEELCTKPEKLESFAPEEVERVILAFISGSRLTFGQRRIIGELGIFERPATIEIWGRILLDLKTEEWPVFVLIDEFDAALLNRISAQELLFDLRRLYDETLFGMCIVIGLKGEPKHVREKLGPALYSRMSLQPIYFPHLSKNKGLDFLIDVFKHAYGERKQKFLPFTKESAETLVSISCPCTPRRLLRICSVVFEEARREGLKRIDKDFVLRTVAKFGEISVSVPPLRKAKPEARPEITEPPTILEGVVEYGSNGTPNILVAPSELTAKKVIGLVLYSKRPTSLALREIKELVSRNWKSVSIHSASAHISRMRELVIREGKRGSYRYILSGLGKSWIENDLVPHLKGEEIGEKKDRRGGVRRALYSPKIDEMIEEGYFKVPRKVPDVIEALREKGLPVTGKGKAVLEALKRRLGKALKGTKEEKEWVFWTD